MSWTDIPSGESRRPSCHVCGEHSWAFVGYCMSMNCAGHYLDDDYPRSMPAWMKAERDAKIAGKQPVRKKKAPAPKKPPAKGRRALELQYEARGEVAPWLENAKPEGS